MTVSYFSRLLVALFLMAYIGTLISPHTYVLGTLFLLVLSVFLSTKISKFTEMRSHYLTKKEITTAMILLGFFLSCAIAPPITLETNPLATSSPRWELLS